jgi:hypothetical protein
MPKGKRAKAHDLLEPIYGWFTEGEGYPVARVWADRRNEAPYIPHCSRNLARETGRQKVPVLPAGMSLACLVDERIPIGEKVRT